eukprot:CAMPEP_0194028418 /NCGR_PEP_ID=MMETSP0009_2-20130614/2385_1 /TAXON_ID=210454 /ORGANISM="Grammatophora oceanica, Strain CCMP 410" /LENGTH=1176 /DNA_ID=CAMNT_0038667807 /DNA_START=154 /DNA_END=3684 /DNA_ORIENTATION=+
MPLGASTIVNSATELLINTPVSLVSTGVKTVSRPIKAVGDAIIYNIVPTQGPKEVGADEGDLLDERLSLEGHLFVRKGKSTGNTAWKWRAVCLDFDNGGSITVYRLPKHVRKKTTKVFRNMYSQIHRAKSIGKALGETESREAVLHFGASIPWFVKDVNDASCFVIEVPTTDPRVMMLFHDDDMGSGGINDSDDSSSYSQRLYGSNSSDSRMDKDAVKDMEGGYYAAKAKSKPMRFYLKCPRRGNEKTLWLKAFDRLDRLSTDIRKKQNIAKSLGALTTKRYRLRSDNEEDQFFRDTRQLEIGPTLSPKNSLIPSRHDDVEHLTRSPGQKRKTNMEFRVYPTYCYPHVWLTQDELKEECDLPSTEFHDMRIPSQKSNEIGALQVEVLQCMGLPKLDRSSESDAVVYLVCGSYAFSTDVIPSNKNPMWLRKTRRACVLPVTDGFARLYAGVFDDDPKDTKDDFAGRVVIDLARLRPGSLYDVLLPLRQSAHVFSRKPCGAIRLRFQLNWNERKALLSYLPKTVKFRNFKPRCDTTIACTDSKSFRNVAITVHGAHLPKKFTFTQFKAVMREVNFTRKSLMLVVRLTIKETRQWKIPAISCFVFVAWMHAVYRADFSLVLPYFIMFLLLHMIRLYAKYGIDGPSQRGFIPASIEEMFLAFVNGGEGRHQIKPLEMSVVQKDTQVAKQSKANETLNFHTHVISINTHTPWGKWLLRFFGLLERPEELSKMAPNERHLEFPFADGNYYPKFSVKEALVGDEEQKKNNINQTLALTNLTLNPEDDGGYNDDDSYEQDQFDQLIADENRRRYFAGIENIARLPLHGRNHDNQDGSTSELSTELMLSTTPSHDEYDDDGFIRKPRPPSNELPPYMRMPQQDLDAKPDPNSVETKITEDLAEIKDKMHELTLRLFDDRTHVVKHPDAQYFGASRKSKKNKDAFDELEKNLEVGVHSSSNLIISRVGSYLEPLIGATMPWLCLARTTFNIFTWRDPFLSLWVVVYGVIATVILFYFPWRMFFGIAGMLVVGPQNWVVSYFRERRGKTEKPYVASPDDGDDLFLGGDLPEDQPLFGSHPPVNQRYRGIDRNRIDPREVHHVVVPHTRLMYQRFYDWPPEARHAYVRERSFHSSRNGNDSRRKNSFGSASSSNHSSTGPARLEGMSPKRIKGTPKKLIKKELAPPLE